MKDKLVLKTSKATIPMKKKTTTPIKVTVPPAPHWQILPI
jgi:hypothetical protein